MTSNVSRPAYILPALVVATVAVVASAAVIVKQRGGRVRKKTGRQSGGEVEPDMSESCLSMRKIIWFKVRK